MRTIILVLLTMLLAGASYGQTVCTAVTPNDETDDINKVKVRCAESFTQAELDAIQRVIPEFVPPVTMNRLELIDQEIAALQAQIDALTIRVADMQVFRGKVDKEAKKVKLVVP